MRLVILILALCLFLVSPAFSDPLLVCDPIDPVYQVQGFRGEINGQPFDTAYKEIEDDTATFGKSALILDCAGMGDEAWHFTNVRVYNVRGEGIGIPFEWPALPESLLKQNIHLKSGKNK